MVDLYAVLNKGNNFLIELDLKIPKKNSWKQSVFFKGALIGAIIAVVGLIFSHLSVLITGLLWVGGCLVASFVTNHRLKNNMNEVNTLAVEKFDMPKTPKTPKTPKSIPLNPFEKLAEKEQKINELQSEVNRLKRQYGIK